MEEKIRGFCAGSRCKLNSGISGKTWFKMTVMARSVTISTPIPTLEEFGKSLGLSKTRQDSLLRLVRVRRDSKSGRYFVERHRNTAGTLKEKDSDFRSKK